MKLIMLGAPGAGKGTQAQVLAQALAIPTISTGEMLREAIAVGSELGRSAQKLLDQGQLVPDEVVTAMIAERVQQSDCQLGFILDGFPRTVAQAQALDEMQVQIDLVLMLEVADENILTRLAGRRVCSGCGTSYHTVYHPTETPGICDRCGKHVIRREDDDPVTVTERLRVYHERTEPLKSYYQEKGILKIVIGQEQITDTTNQTLNAVGLAR